MKTSKHSLILLGIALVAVLTLALIIPFVKTAIYWVALLCTLAMFGLCAFSFVRAFHQGEGIESKLLGWPIFKVGYVAVLLQVVVGFALMGLSTLCPLWAAIIVEVLLFALTAFSMTVKDAAREVVVASEANVVNQTAAWKAIRARAAAIAAETGHPDIKKLAEEIRFADPTPTEMDGEIANMLETLSSYADAENIRKATQLVQQRKTISKTGKK